jgi:hypothetical protein
MCGTTSPARPRRWWSGPQRIRCSQRPTSWIAYGGCLAINDFDNVVPYGGAVRLAQFTAPDGVTTPYPYARRS